MDKDYLVIRLLRKKLFFSETFEFEYLYHHIFVGNILKKKLKKSINEFAQIRSGLFLKPQESGDIVYLQVKFFDAEGRLNTSIFPDVKSHEIPQKHLLKPGEILFSAKGWKNFATVYEESDLPAVASTSFLVISLFEDYITPDFLAMWLNSPDMREMLKNIAKGTSIPSITKAQLSDLKVPIFPLEIQGNLVRLSQLKETKKSILDRIDLLESLKLDMNIKKVFNRYE